MITLSFTPEQLAVIDRALQAQPYAIAAPLIAEINRQIAEKKGEANESA